MSEPKVAVLMGSRSILPKIKATIKTLDEFGVRFSVRVMSAHRTPSIVSDFSRSAAEKGYKVIIAVAGGAAHLAGVVAAHTSLPVIRIAVQGGAFQGMDAYFRQYRCLAEYRWCQWLLELLVVKMQLFLLLEYWRCRTTISRMNSKNFNIPNSRK